MMQFETVTLENTRPEMRRFATPVRSSSSRRKSISNNSKNAEYWAACLVRVQAQDQEAFVALFHHFAPRIKAYLVRVGGSATQAEEATQEAMATVWHKARLFNPAKASAATWIYTIALNKQLDAIRKQNRPEPEELTWGDEDSSDPEAEVNVAQEQELLKAAVQNLPTNQRILIEKAFFGDLSHAEIADETNLPLGTIKSRIRLGLERLRREMASMQR